VIEVQVIHLYGAMKLADFAAIADLHRKELSGTLTSLRGNKLVTGMYKRLLKHDGSIAMAKENGMLVGVLSYTPNYRKLATLSSVMFHPHTWLRIILTKGPTNTIKELMDARSVLQLIKVFDNQMLYITTLFVASGRRKSGIAQLLYDVVKLDAEKLQLPIVVDTRLDNEIAHRFYEHLGMHDFRQTSLSRILCS